MQNYNHLKDKTLERNSIGRFIYLIKIYEEVKKKQHPEFRFLNQFYAAYNLKRQTFLKFYDRF